MINIIITLSVSLYTLCVLFISFHNLRKYYETLCIRIYDIEGKVYALEEKVYEVLIKGREKENGSENNIKM